SLIVATIFPPGPAAIEAVPLPGLTAPAGWSVRVDRSMIMPERVVAARILPSGLNSAAEAVTCTALVRRKRAASHHRAIPSQPPVARLLLTGLKATDSTPPSQLLDAVTAGPLCLWVATSHTRILPSLFPVASSPPSELNAIEFTP